MAWWQFILAAVLFSSFGFLIGALCASGKQRPAPPRYSDPDGF